MNVKQLAIRVLREQSSFGAESPIVRMLDGVFDGMEGEILDDGCISCLHDRLTRWLDAAVGERRLLNYRIDDLRVANGEITGTILITPVPTPYIDITFTVTDRGVEL